MFTHLFFVFTYVYAPYCSPFAIKDAVDDTIHCVFYFCKEEGTRKIKSQYAGGILLPPVQTLVATYISAQGAEMQTSPFRRAT